MEAVGIEPIECYETTHTPQSSEKDPRNSKYIDSLSLGHTHRFFHIIYVISARGTKITIHHRTKMMKAADVYILPPQTLHHYDFTSGDSHLYELKFNITDPELYRRIQNIAGVIENAGGKIKEQFRHILQWFPRRFEDESVCLFIRLLLCELSRRSGQSNLLPQTLALPEEIEQILDHIHKNYRDDMSVEDMARTVHRERAYFSKKFKKYTGVTPMNYLNSVRITNSLNLLEYTDREIMRIAEEVGFKSANSYTKLFKKLYSVSPGEYRKAVRTKNTKVIKNI